MINNSKSINFNYRVKKQRKFSNFKWRKIFCKSILRKMKVSKKLEFKMKWLCCKNKLMNKIKIKN